jgi:uncharacterized cupin superfamily protein
MAEDPGYKGARYEDMPSLWDGFAHLVRPGLGVTAFGVNVMNLPPDYETKSHDEAESGQEELYVGLEGSGWVVMGDGARCALDNHSAVRVSPGTARVLASGPDGLRVMIVGSQPGRGYVGEDWSSGDGA